MNDKTVLLLLAFLSMKYNVYSQSKNLAYSDKQKGHISISWGWNRAAYTKSNISFKGSDYDFKLYHIVAHDRPTLPISFHNYLKPDHLTIPQTNLRISYFIKDNLAISFGDDHMKYVMDQNQTARIKGQITRSGMYQGNYDNDIQLTEQFLTFEHTDGLNYLNIELEKYFNWYHSKSDQLIVAGMIGGGAGALLPKSNVKLLDYERNDRFHLSGFGLSAKMGMQATFFKHLILKFENKYGYINMPNIILHKKGIEGRAKQGFFFAELYGTIGASFRIAGKNPNRKKK
ncbi:MAG TPA: hypothetical protein PKW62_00875 [Chitinophagaceae bacterium]|nr:hypothetical protein [Chitinophagaceae bacterium]MCB0740559.1 hypothetical protein [Chitinophagaceae bacterium]HQV05280.1 hypothetical protein [Chitinophagaceae bacterium]